MKELSRVMGIQYFCYQLTGRFGNQILGLSDAFLMARQTNMRPLLLMSEAHLSSSTPSWIHELKDTSWFDVAFGQIESKPMITKRTVFSEGLQIKTSPEVLYTGFTPNFQAIAESGLLTQEHSPFILETETLAPKIAICVRRGDYVNNPHLGILPMTYYKKSLRMIQDKYGPIGEVGIFVDSPSTQKMVTSSWLADLGPVIHSTNYLVDWTTIRRAQIIVAANSTFSYTAALRPSVKSYFPDPFYLMDPKFQEFFFPSKSSLVTYRANNKGRYIYLRVRDRLHNLIQPIRHFFEKCS